MKKILIPLLTLAIAPSLPAAISLVATGTAGTHMFIGNVGAGSAKWNTVPAGASANLYWDADGDSVFGESGIGENFGNTAAGLGFTINITSATSYNFAVEGFTDIGTNPGAEFGIQKSDASVERILVLNGATESFTDSNGDMWEVEYVFTEQAYGNVVDNITHTGGGDGTLDHQGVLTFTMVPEPSSTALLGLGGLALILRRRK